jgi:hypothetical protein
VRLIKKQRDVVQVRGERASVHVVETDDGDALKCAFGVALPSCSEFFYTAVLKPQPPSDGRHTPVEVWVNGFRIGHVDDRQSGRYWDRLMGMDADVTCGCIVRTLETAEKKSIRLSLPVAL